MAAFGAIVDQLPPSSKYEIRFAGNYADPDSIDGLQSYIDFPATTNFMRVGRTAKVVHASTSANPSVVTVIAHGLVTGNVITIRGHLGNTAINGTWPVAVIDNDTFTVPVAGSGTGTADTGHVVQLSLAIDSTGNLNVYGNIQADTFVANGTATFNAAIRALGGSLARSLQHSVTGEYGDTTVNRLLLDGGNQLLMGNPGGGTNAEVVRLGTYSIAGAPVARTTASFNSPATGSKGWNDPDGVDDGVNSLSHTGNNVTTVPAASRLYVKLGVSAEGDFVDAYDDNYILKFGVNASYISGGNPTAVVTSTVAIEYSTNSGGSWSGLAGSYAVNAGGTSSGFPASASTAFNPTVQVTGSPAHVWFRLVLTLQSSILDSTHHTGSSSGSVSCFAGVYKTNNYDTTWTTSSGNQVRRGLKLLASTNGTDNMPHVYLEPVPAITPKANAAEGEAQYVGGSVHEMYVRRDDDWVSVLQKNSVKVYHSAGQSVADNTTAVLNFNTEDHDTNAFHDTVTNNTRLTIPSGIPTRGIWMVIGNINWAGVTSQVIVGAQIRLNGTTIVARQQGAHTGPLAGTSTEDSIEAVAILKDPIAGDYYELLAYQRCGVARSTVAGVSNTWLALVKLW